MAGEDKTPDFRTAKVPVPAGTTDAEQSRIEETAHGDPVYIMRQQVIERQRVRRRVVRYVYPETYYVSPYVTYSYAAPVYVSPYYDSVPYYVSPYVAPSATYAVPSAPVGFGAGVTVGGGGGCSGGFCRGR